MTQIHWLEEQGPITEDRWARDHTSTLLFAETQAVDNGGRLHHAKMRVDRRYPTRLANGDEIIGHTDYDCLRDADALGYLKQYPTEESPGTQVIFTAKGWKYVHKLRRECAERGLDREITPSALRRYDGATI